MSDLEQIKRDILLFYDAAGREAQAKWGPNNPNVDYIQTFHNEKAGARASLMTAGTPDNLADAIRKVSKSMERTAKNSAPETYKQFQIYISDATKGLRGQIDPDSPIWKALEEGRDLVTPWYKSEKFWGKVGIGVAVLIAFRMIKRGKG